MAGYSMGLAAGTNIPIEHLDYNYIGKCNKASEVEKILRVLRSKKEGDFPELIQFTEDRLRSLKPDSKLLIVPQKLKRVDDLEQESWRELKTDLEQWEHLMSGEDGKLTSDGTSSRFAQDMNDDLPPIRSSGTITTDKEEAKKQPAGKHNPDRIKSWDFKSWDKYDAGREADRVDAARNSEKQKATTSHLPDTVLSAKEQSVSGTERDRLALKEREKGNEAFKSGDYEEAHAYYTRSLQFSSTLLAFNNRAMAAIKLERFPEAISDCSRVLQDDPTNTKALLRKATAHRALKEYREAKILLEQILQSDPNSKRAQEMLNTILQEYSPEDEPKSSRKGRKVVIQEVDGSEETSSKNLTVPSSESVPKQSDRAQATPTPMPHSTTVPQPLPPFIKVLKDKGNDLFRTGQYSDALHKYSQAIHRLEKDHPDHTQSLATLLSNRAACHLKIGDCRSCIQDCDRSISITPINLKSFMRRAAAYETLEKYGNAYNDYQLALRIDSRVEAAHAGCGRIMPLLRDRDGGGWRNKLPVSPDTDKVKSALSAMNQLYSPAPPNHGSENVGTKANEKVGVSDVNKEFVSTPATIQEDSSDVSLPSSIRVVTSSASSGEQMTLTQSASTITSTSATATMATREGSSKEDPALRRAKFDDWKRQGNSHVQKQAYGQALRCYAECIQLLPGESIPYANRAQCFLKLGKFVEAEEDCSRALEIDDKNVKALFRRVLARKGLCKYQEALKDISLLKKLEPANKAVKKEEPAIKDLYLKQLREIQSRQLSDAHEADAESKCRTDQECGGGNSTVTEKKRRKVIVEEVSEPNSSSKEKWESQERERSNVLPPGHADKYQDVDLSQIPVEKLPAGQFIPRWNSLSRSASPHQYAILLKQIPPAMLPQVITSKLDSTALSNVIAALDRYFIPQGLYNEVCDILVHLPLVQRFSIVSLSPSPNDKIALKRIFTTLVEKKPEALTLQKTYGL